MSLARSLQKMEKNVEGLFRFRSHDTRKLVKNVGLVSAGITALVLGVVVGRELRERYKFTRQTPYDLYGHSGESDGLEFGVGV